MSLRRNPGSSSPPWLLLLLLEFCHQDLWDKHSPPHAAFDHGVCHCSIKTNCDILLSIFLKQNSPDIDKHLSLYKVVIIFISQDYVCVSKCICESKNLYLWPRTQYRETFFPLSLPPFFHSFPLILGIVPKALYVPNSCCANELHFYYDSYTLSPNTSVVFPEPHIPSLILRACCCDTKLTFLTPMELGFPEH